MSNLRRKICVVTGTRAEYGLLFWLLKELQNNAKVELQLVVTGMHLSPEFGSTYKIIEGDGFEISARVRMLLSDDSGVAITKSTGLGLIGFADAFDNLKPDIVVLLGDRFEILAAAQSAMFARIPIAHIHGGEATEGLIDEAIRHSVTKMAHLHFVAAAPYRKKVIQLGESPKRVFNFGAPGLDWLKKLNWLSRTELEEQLGIVLRKPIFLITYHPVTLEEKGPEESMRQLLYALDCFPKASTVFTYPNADTNGRAIIELIEAYTKSHPDRCKAFSSLGQQRYLSLMRESDVVIGNSSSGLTEAPALKKATVNIGDRQRGRLKASSVIDCVAERSDITNAIRRALNDDFRSTLPETLSLYGEGGSSKNISRVLCDVDLAQILKKEFYLL